MLVNNCSGGAHDSQLAVLMTVYHKVNSTELDRALESLTQQTLLPDHLVIVEDGPLTAELTAVLDAFAPNFAVDRIKLATNQGSGPASQAGLAVITAEWTARADADDISLPERFERQLAYLNQQARDGHRLDVIGTAMSEFVGEEDHVVGIRRLPADHESISRYTLLNNPINHPTIMYRTELVKSVGGYQHVPLMEDYDLMARLLAGGAIFHNLDQPLVLFRASTDMFKRRKAQGMFAAERQMQANLRDYGLVGRLRSTANLIVRSTFRVLPVPALKYLYRWLFHR